MGTQPTVEKTMPPSEFPADPIERLDRPMPGIADMTAVILCGGQGTRLREETEFKPKPMVEVGGRPILWHIMKLYRHFGVRNFVLCLGYRGDMIRDYFLNYRLRNSDFAVDLGTGALETLTMGESEDWRVVLAETGAETQTAQRLRRALRFVRGNSFFATYGDGLADVDLHALLAHHRRQRRAASVTAVHPSSRFGELAIGGGLVKSFQEKPQVTEGWINGGFMVFEKRAFDNISPDDNLPLEAGVLEMLAQRQELAVYQHGGFWQCMDTYREMCLLNEMWAKGGAPWQVWQECSSNRLTA
jgi:glucose-1-phosphate cytidylyltransferase